uniref:Major facilitator superfamily (MFS) profile domain-containing protein n=1 Tax=Panagrolaimus davidi TaxID=227884 RepID=A0A914PGY7_9BILA
MITLNFTFICMIKEGSNDNISTSTPVIPSEVPQLNSVNFTSSSKPQVEYYYSQHEKSLLIWAVAVAAIFATFPFTFFYSKFGAKYVLLFAGLLSATATAFVPLSVEMGIYPFLALRICQGIAYAAVFAAIGVLCSRWASLKQNGIFISVLTCFSYIASSVTNPVAGAVSYH